MAEEKNHEDEEWREAVKRAIAFQSKHFNSFAGEIFEEDLSEEEKKELQELTEILGKNVMQYIGWNDDNSVPPSYSEEVEKRIQEEFTRMLALTREQLCAEAEKEAEDPDFYPEKD